MIEIRKETFEGKARLEWWGKEKFRGRRWVIEGRPGVVREFPIPDDEIRCDLCDKPMTEFPVPVVFYPIEGKTMELGEKGLKAMPEAGGNAYCRTCFDGVWAELSKRRKV